MALAQIVEERLTPGTRLQKTLRQDTPLRFDSAKYTSGLNVRPLIRHKSEEAFWADLGLDIEWASPAVMTFGLTYNTDFAEAEVNDQQINLTRFFLENAGFFGLGLSSPGAPSLNPFFSRRIGIKPVRHDRTNRL